MENLDFKTKILEDKKNIKENFVFKDLLTILDSHTPNTYNITVNVVQDNYKKNNDLAKLLLVFNNDFDDNQVVKVVDIKIGGFLENAKKENNPENV